jgi:DMSO/TMAO reductase YedYZ molybdopterin-dependent catalytic subunit
MTGTIDRRKFMAVGGVTAVTAAAAGIGGAHLLGKRPPATGSAMNMAAPPATPTATPTRTPTPTPTPKLKVTPKPQPLQPSLDIAGISPFYTPEPQFYRVDTTLVVPQVNAATWQLRIHGMVDRPMTISYNQLMQQAMVEHDITLACVSESVGGGYIGNARWQGTLLADVLRQAGIQAGADQIVIG